MMFKPTNRAPALWFKSTTRPQDITLAIIITIMSLTICNKVGEKMPSTTFINDAQKCSKNIITCKELNAQKCNNNIVICKMLDPNQSIMNEQKLLADLLRAPRQAEFNSLVRILTDNDLARTPSATDQA